MTERLKRRRSWPFRVCLTLFVVASLVLAFVVWEQVITPLTAAPVKQALVNKMEAEIPTMVGTPAPTSSTAPSPATPLSVTSGQVFGLVRIPRFGSSYVEPLLEGTDENTLQKGIGHYTGTAMPCQVGNFAMAGHRTTYAAPFHEIALLQPGDQVIVQTKAFTCTYRVTSIEIVKPTAIQVLDPVPDHPGQAPVKADMTMTSCHPMYFATERYVVHGRLESQTTN